MSNSNLYGTRDRRIPTAPVRRIQPAEVLNRIYDEAGYEPTGKATEPTSAIYLEQQAFDNALQHMDPAEKRAMNELLDKLASRMGRGAGRNTAIQILGKLGIFFAANDYKGRS